MNMVSTPPVPTMVTLISSLNVSMSTTMKHLVASMSHVLFWSILSLAPWTQSDLDHMGKSSDQITLSLANLVLETTGQRDTTQKVLSWLTQF